MLFAGSQRFSNPSAASELNPTFSLLLSKYVQPGDLNFHPRAQLIKRSRCCRAMTVDFCWTLSDISWFDKVTEDISEALSYFRSRINICSCKTRSIALRPLCGTNCLVMLSVLDTSSTQERCCTLNQLFVAFSTMILRISSGSNAVERSCRNALLNPSNAASVAVFMTLSITVRLPLVDVPLVHFACRSLVLG